MELACGEASPIRVLLLMLCDALAVAATAVTVASDAGIPKDLAIPVQLILP